MSVKDAVGNELHEGDLILIKLDDPYCLGRVGKMTDGGLSIANGGKKSPGMIQVICAQTIAYNPGPNANIGAIFKLQNPVSQQVLNELVNKANSEAGS